MLAGAHTSLLQGLEPHYPLSGEAFAIKFDGKGIAGQKLPGAWAQVLLRHSLGEGAYRGNSLIRNDLP